MVPVGDNKKNKMLIDGKTFYKQKMLGRGAYGKVFKVKDENDETFAIKRVTYSEKDGVYADIIKEMDFLRRFSSHPNIIELCGYKWDSQMFTMLMEFGGIPMHKFIDIYRYEYRMEVLPDILWQLIMTLAYIHEHQTCHRDIKPDNILINEIITPISRTRSHSHSHSPSYSHSRSRSGGGGGRRTRTRSLSDYRQRETPLELDELPSEEDGEVSESPRKSKRTGQYSSPRSQNSYDYRKSGEKSEEIEIHVKLCDFGLSKTLVLKRNTPKTSTLWYRSPENLAELKEYTTKIDVWALGCVIYEYVTDEVLFEADNTQDTLLKVMRTLGPFSDRDLRRLDIDKSKLPKKWRKYTMIPFEDKQLEDLLMQCLTINPDDRPTAVDLLKHPYFYNRGYSVSELYDDFRDINTRDERYRPINEIKSDALRTLLGSSRKSVLDWLFNVSTLEGTVLKPHTIFLGIELFDRVMQKWDTSIDQLNQLKYISIACMDIASKFLEIYPIDLQRVYEYNNKQHYQKLKKEYDNNPSAFSAKPVAPRITRDDVKEFIIKVNKYEQKILFLLDFVVHTQTPYLTCNEDIDKAKSEVYSRTI